MSLTYQNLQDAIVRELLNRSDLTTEIQAAIQSAIYHYQKFKFWFSEETDTALTVNGQPSLAVPTDFGYVDGLTILFSSGTLPIRMQRVDWSVMQDYGANSTVSPGLPTEYAIYADQFWFWPTPNGAYLLTLYHNFLNAPPTNGTDLSVWSDQSKAEELIRSRAIADIKCHILHNDTAKMEMSSVAGEGYFSMRERIAHKNLLSFTNRRISSGYVKPFNF